MEPLRRTRAASHSLDYVDFAALAAAVASANHSPRVRKPHVPIGTLRTHLGGSPASCQPCRWPASHHCANRRDLCFTGTFPEWRPRAGFARNGGQKTTAPAPGCTPSPRQALNSFPMSKSGGPPLPTRFAVCSSTPERSVVMPWLTRLLNLFRRDRLA